MKKIRKHALTTAIAATLAGGMSSLASAQPVVGVLLHAPTVGDVLAVGLLGDTGLVDLNVAGSRIALTPDSNPIEGLPSLLNDLQNGTGLPLSDLANALGSIDDSPLPGLPSDPADLLSLLPTDGGIPSLPIDPAGAVIELISGGGAPSLPGLPVDPVGALTGLIPSGGGVPSLPGLPVDPVGTLTGLIPSGGSAPSLPGLPVDAIGALTGALPAGALPLDALPALPLDALPLP